VLTETANLQVDRIARHSQNLSHNASKCCLKSYLKKLLLFCEILFSVYFWESDYINKELSSRSIFHNFFW